MADDYFAAIQCIEQRPDFVPEPAQTEQDEAVKVQERTRAIQLTEKLLLPELRLEERIAIVAELRELFGAVQEHPPRFHPLPENVLANGP